MDQNNAKKPPGPPTAVGPGGQNTNRVMQKIKKPRRDPTVPQCSEVQRELGGANFIGTQPSSPGPTANAVRIRGAQLLNGGSGLE